MLSFDLASGVAHGGQSQIDVGGHAAEVIVRELDEFIGESSALFVGEIQRRRARNCS
jgi:hypothetical protein